MGTARPLHLVPGFFGADEVLTDSDEGAAAWVATLISRAGDRARREPRRRRPRGDRGRL